jgi:alpha/beta superfamily hydrolase
MEKSNKIIKRKYKEVRKTIKKETHHFWKKKLIQKRTEIEEKINRKLKCC